MKAHLSDPCCAAFDFSPSGMLRHNRSFANKRTCTCTRRIGCAINGRDPPRQTQQDHQAGGQNNAKQRLFDSLGEVISTFILPVSVAIASEELIHDLQHLSSYSWVDAEEPKIIVPGRVSHISINHQDTYSLIRLNSSMEAGATPTGSHSG